MGNAKLGLICRGDFTGLSIQTQSLYNHLNPVATLVVNSQRWYPNKLPRMELFGPEAVLWDVPYPSVTSVYSKEVDDFLSQVDVVLTCETPYNYYLMDEAKRRGVKTVLVPNPEFFEYFSNPDLTRPDLILLPTLWMEDQIRAQAPEVKTLHLPVPIDREMYPYTHRTEASTLLHLAGTMAGDDRNGTLLLIESMRHVKSPVKCVIRSQRRLELPGLPDNVDMRVSVAKEPRDLYEEEDIMVLPRRFTGNCMPLWEAMSLGMPTLMLDRSPENGFLPEELLVACRVKRQLMVRTSIDIYSAGPMDVADKIDFLYDNPNIVEDMSDLMDYYAEQISWTNMHQKYLDVFSELVDNN